MIDFLMGNSVLVTGIEDDDEPEFTRVYIGQRALKIYCVVSGDEADEIRRAWGATNHLFITRPPDDRMYKED